MGIEARSACACLLRCVVVVVVVVESWAIAKMTARCALCMGALKNSHRPPSRQYGRSCARKQTTLWHW